LAVAIGFAAVVHEARCVALEHGIHDVVVIDPKHVCALAFLERKVVPDVANLRCVVAALSLPITRATHRKGILGNERNSASASCGPRTALMRDSGREQTTGRTSSPTYSITMSCWLISRVQKRPKLWMGLRCTTVRGSARNLSYILRATARSRGVRGLGRRRAWRGACCLCHARAHKIRHCLRTSTF